MSPKLLVCTLFAAALCAQTPNISGVWKADLQRSKFPAPPGGQGPPRVPSNYLVIIEQNGDKVVEKTGVYMGHNEERSTLAFAADGKPNITNFHGVPTQVTASWSGNTLTLSEDTVGAHATSTKETDEVSADGQTLTVDLTASSGDHQQHTLLVLTKQPDSAGDPLRKPEQTAAERFKNVKTGLKTLPVSEFIDTMHYFSFSLGQNCEFCHVAHHFDSDDKKPKLAARAMIAMVHTADTETFKGKPKVLCYTCHAGYKKPLSRPLFPGETRKDEDEHLTSATQGTPKPVN
ncbi:MAG: photosynthetic reaction center cytochrome c subunit family protein [Bryobacteraceae bacterium]